MFICFECLLFFAKLQSFIFDNLVIFSLLIAQLLFWKELFNGRVYYFVGSSYFWLGRRDLLTWLNVLIVPRRFLLLVVVFFRIGVIGLIIWEIAPLWIVLFRVFVKLRMIRIAVLYHIVVFSVKGDEGIYGGLLAFVRTVISIERTVFYWFFRYFFFLFVLPLFGSTFLVIYSLFKGLIYFLNLFWSFLAFFFGTLRVLHRLFFFFVRLFCFFNL